MYRTLQLSRSGFYHYCSRKPSSRNIRNRLMTQKIINIFNDSRETYGARRIVSQLDETCSRDRCRRLMRKANLVAKKQARRKKRYTTSGSKNMCENVLQRRFTEDEPNRIWVGNIKYIWTQEGWLYLATVIDLFSRKVVGWSMSKDRTAQIVCDALEMAILHRNPAKGLIFHSDQGCQYTSKMFQKLLKDSNMKGSMSGRGQCLDNAVAESFFSRLDTELLWSQSMETRAKGRWMVFDYIELFYNRKRVHSSLGNVSPEEYENRYQEEIHSSEPRGVVCSYFVARAHLLLLTTVRKTIASSTFFLLCVVKEFLTDFFSLVRNYFLLLSIRF